MKPIIFLSHSSNKDPDTAPLVDKLSASLQADGFEVCLDRERLTGGEDWRDELHRWLGYCHGAVVVLSEKALASPWVLKETSILEWRRSLAKGDAPFTLVPIRCQGIDSKRLDASAFKSLAPGLPQHVPHDAPDLVARVLAKLQPLKAAMAADTPEDLLLQKIATLIRGAGEPLLKTVAANLGAPMPAWRSLGDLDVAYQAAALLLRARPGQLRDALRPLAGVVDATHLRMIADFVASRALDVAAAAILAGQTREPGGQRAALLNARRHELSDLYAKRAHGQYPGWFVINTESRVVGEDLVSDITDQVVAAMARYCDDPDDRLDMLNDLSRPDPILASFKLRPDDALLEAGELRRLCAQLRRVTFVLLTGAALPAPSMLADVRRLEPALADGQEDELFKTIREFPKNART